MTKSTPMRATKDRRGDSKGIPDNDIKWTKGRRRIHRQGQQWIDNRDNKGYIHGDSRGYAYGSNKG